MPSSDMDVDRPRSREDVPSTDDFIIGDRVWVNGTKPGYIQYLGETQFSPGDWAGVVLDDHSGKNDGSVAGVRYFQCEPKRGVFARLHKLTRYPLLHAASHTSSKLSDTPTPPPLQRCLTPTRTPSPGSRILREGDRVQVVGSTGPHKTGVLRYLGQTDFAAGEWAGIELDEPLGKNDGTVAGKRYFRCSPNYGLFSPVHKVSRVSGSLDRHRGTHNMELERENPPKMTSTPNEKEEQRRPSETEGDRRVSQRLRQLLEVAEAERRDLAAQLDEERKKVEELEFRIEEECIGKDDLEVEREKERRRIEELERRLEQEVRKNELVAGGASPDSVLKEETERLREETESLREKLRKSEHKIRELQTTREHPAVPAAAPGSHPRSDEMTRKEEALLQVQMSLDNKKRECQNLLDRIAEMEKELEKNKGRQSRQLDAIDELNRKLQKSDSKAQSLEEEVHASGEKTEEMERRLKTSAERVEFLEREKRKLEQRLLKPESTSHDEERALLLSRLQDREREASEWRKEAESARKEADRLREEKDRMRRDLEEKIRTLEESHQEEWRREKKRNAESSDASSSRIRELERQLSEVRRDLDSAKTEAEARLSRQEARLQEAELKAQDLERLRDQASRLQAERDLLRVEKEDGLKRLQSSEEARSRWESEASRSTREVEYLESQVRHLKTEFSTHRQDLLEKLAETRFDAKMVQDLHEEIEEQRRLVESMQSKLRNTEGERDQLQSALSSKQEDQAQVERSLLQEVETLKKRLSESEAERQSVHGSLEATRRLVEERTESHRHLQAQRELRNDREKERLEKRVAELQAELAERADANGRSADDPGDIEYEKLKIDKDALEQQVHFLNSVIVDMQHKNDDLRSRLDILETEVLFDGPLRLGLVQNRSTSRLFCDTCDLFDVHDAEDCPKRHSVRRTLSYSSQESEF